MIEKLDPSSGEALRSISLLDKINELIDVVNDLEEKYPERQKANDGE